MRQSVLRICVAVSGATEITVAEITGRSRNRYIVRARQMAFAIAADQTSLSMAEIGRQFGRDHSTVIYGIGQARALLQNDVDYAFDYVEASSQAAVLLSRRDIPKRERIRVALPKPLPKVEAKKQPYINPANRKFLKAIKRAHPQAVAA